MVTREKIIEEIEKLPDERLDELYGVIKNLEMKTESSSSNQSVMARLREIRISAAPDFSVKAKLYDFENGNA